MRAWTLGYPPAYEVAVRIPGNAKAPGGVAFATREEAIAWRDKHRDEEYLAEGRRAGEWEPYEIELPAPIDMITSIDRRATTMAFHKWHGGTFDLRCGECMGDDLDGELSQRSLLVEAPLINPDTGQPA